MSEENTVVPEQLTDTQQLAVEQGWVPKEKYEGDPEKWVDAGEFLRRGELFAKIEQQSRESKQLRTALKALKEHYTKVEQASYEKALKDLKNKEKEALVEGDVEKYYQIKEEIEEAETQAAQASQVAEALDVQEPPQIHPEFAAWKHKNSWYDSVKYMREFADDLGTNLARQGVPPKEVLKQVEQAVRKEFPQKFTNANKSNAPDVEGSSRQSGGKRDDFELSADEKKIMETLIRTDPKTFSKEKYIADLKKIKGIA